MDLTDEEHRIRREIREMSMVDDEEYIGAPPVGEAPRLFVQFDSRLDNIPQSFQAWADDNDLNIITERFEDMDTGNHLCIELQHEDQI